LRAGDTVLVLLAAAQRDPEAAGTFAFGAGAHECVGAEHARAVARSVVCELLARGLALRTPLDSLSYLPYPNVRIPRLS
jgi:cytochrome P450